MDVILEQIEANLASANCVEIDIQHLCDRELKSQQNQQLEWIQRQLSTLLGKLQGMLEDLNSGLSIAEMGFSDPAEINDFLQDLTAQIAQLKSIAQSIGKEIGQSL